MKRKQAGVPKKLISLFLSTALMVSLAGCGNSAAVQETPAANQAVETEKESEAADSSQAADKSVNIAVTDTIGSLNPLLMDATEIVKYAESLTFLSLVELDEQLNFVGQLAKEITTEDNIHFTIRLDEDAVWSDGEPVTADDVLYSFLCWVSPEVGNTGNSVYAIEGVGDDGYVEPGATSIEGVKAVSDKEVEVTLKWPTALYTFENVYGRYILILPYHVLKDVPREELLTYDWFNAPDVISGPYFIRDFDLNHYVHYEANENYWKGAPKIKYLNINVLDASQLLAGLQSGEVDVVQQTTGNILLEDYESVRALPDVNVFEGTPITNQSIFINVEAVPDVRIRQALLYGIDRETLKQEFMKGTGEIVDAFLASEGPFYDASLGVTGYDPEKAKALIEEAVGDGADSHLTFYVNSGDTTFVQAASYIAAQFAQIGLTLEVKTVDLATLMTVANDGTFDVMAVQYTYAPVDPYTDVAWLLSVDGWTRYSDEEVDEALLKTQSLVDLEAIKAEYLKVDQKVVEDVPMISAYVISALGAANKRLVNVKPNVFGTFINVHEWDVQ